MSDMTAHQEAPSPATDHAHDTHSDTVTLPTGQTVTVLGGIYTVIFGVLGALTLLEVLLAELLADGAIRSILLLGIAFIKAGLVVWFYMHLRTDNRLFLVVLGLPTLIVILCFAYLLALPPTGYAY